MLFIGDVGACGYGILNHGLGVASQTARYVAREHSIGCSWTTIAGTELTMIRAASELSSTHLDVDAVVVLLGPPDVLLGTSTVEWSSALEHLIEFVRHSTNPGCTVIVAAIPPMHRFRRIPKFLQRILALHIQRLDQASASVALDLAGVTCSPFPSLKTSGMFAEDALNWRTVHSEWGKQLGQRQHTPSTLAAQLASGPLLTTACCVTAVHVLLVRGGGGATPRHARIVGWQSRANVPAFLAPQSLLRSSEQSRSPSIPELLCPASRLPRADHHAR